MKSLEAVINNLISKESKDENDYTALESKNESYKRIVARIKTLNDEILNTMDGEDYERTQRYVN